ncbi:MAG: hypothetical protein M1541_00445, partial [Acidobacteria bacterium]|nr:hypothetical protein [Acidobacteriota bacterium]
GFEDSGHPAQHLLGCRVADSRCWALRRVRSRRRRRVLQAPRLRQGGQQGAGMEAEARLRPA